MLLSFFKEIPDLRRSNNTTYKQYEILFCTVLSFLCGADSYRKIHSFIDAKFSMLCKEFDFFEKGKIPSYSTIRDIIQGVDQVDLEAAFRKYSQSLQDVKGLRFLACDGKVLRGSFDNFNDKTASQLLSIFCTGDDLILGHEAIDTKSNEIPALRKVLLSLGLTDCIFTADAMHCQKNSSVNLAKQTV